MGRRPPLVLKFTRVKVQALAVSSQLPYLTFLDLLICPYKLAPQIYGMVKYKDLYLYSEIDLWWSNYNIAYFYLYTAKV